MSIDTTKVQDLLKYLGRASEHVEEAQTSQQSLIIEHHKQESWNELIRSLNERLQDIEKKLDNYLNKKEVITGRAREITQKVTAATTTRTEQKKYLLKRIEELQQHLTTIKGEKHTEKTRTLSRKMSTLKKKLKA